jgi:hypothetical protein
MPELKFLWSHQEKTVGIVPTVYVLWAPRCLHNKNAQINLGDRGPCPYLSTWRLPVVAGELPYGQHGQPSEPECWRRGTLTVRNAMVPQAALVVAPRAGRCGLAQAAAASRLLVAIVKAESRR